VLDGLGATSRSRAFSERLAAEVRAGGQVQCRVAGALILRADETDAHQEQRASGQSRSCSN
jgi:hypothetical protein